MIIKSLIKVKNILENSNVRMPVKKIFDTLDPNQRVRCNLLESHSNKTDLKTSEK
jgi:hypothetical protein